MAARVLLPLQSKFHGGLSVYKNNFYNSTHLISIATKSPVSVMVHFAMNITNKGTPVKTLSLQDLKLEPKNVAEDLITLFQKEFESIVMATQKVLPVF